jgi:hypothetical protein
VSDIKKLLSPISTEVLYAFRSENFEFSYDADAEEFTAKNSAACQERSRDEGPLDQLTCRLSILTSKDRTYIAANAYGAQTEVESFEGTYFGVTMKLGSAIVDGYVPKRAVPNGSWVEISDRFKVSISKARKLGNEGINVLYVGRIIGIQIVEGPERICSPPPPPTQPASQNPSPHKLRLNFSHGSSHRHRSPDQAASGAARYRACVP